MACIYTLTLKNGEKRALNDVEFDAFLSDLIKEDANLSKKEIEEMLDEYQITQMFSLDPRIDSIKKVETIQTQISSIISSGSNVTIFEAGEDPDVEKKLHDIPGYIGVTSFTTQYGNPKKGIDTPIVTGFNEDAWEVTKRAELVKDGLSTTEIDNIITATKASWIELKKIGDAIHAIYEKVFKDESTTKPAELDDTLYQDVLQQAQQFKQQLIQRFGNGDPSKVSFYPELSISSKKLDKDLSILLKDKGIHDIAGTIDLLVIDANGKGHIFDYKTSRKHLYPNSWDNKLNVAIGKDEWSSTKKLSVQNQLAAYNTMLEQWGIRNSTCEVVPIFLDLEYTDTYKSSISKIKSIKQQEVQTVPQTSNGAIYQNWKNLLPASVEFTAQSTIDLASKHQTLIPTDHITSIQVQQFQANLEYYKKHVKNVSSEDSHYPEYKFYFVKYETNGRRQYCKNEEDLNKKLEDYVATIKEKKANELFALASTIRRALSNEVSLDDFVRDYNIANRNFLQTQFSRYITEGWDLVSDDNLIGSGIFIFQMAGRSEVVVVSNQQLYTKYKIGKGSSLLGRYVEDQYVDSKNILPANNGNIEAMKAMIFIAEHPEMFRDNRITQLVALNPWRGERTYIHNSQWIENYNRLIESVKEPGFVQVNPNLFWGDIPSLLSIVDSNLKAAENPTELSGFSLNGQISADGNILQFTEEYIENALKKMRSDYAFLVNAENEMIGDQNVWTAYNFLNQTLLSLKGLHTYSELEAGQWMSSGIKAGLMVSSSGYSASTNFRVFDDVMQQFALEVRLAVEKQGRPILAALTEFYNSKGNASTKVFGGEGNFFLNWFNKTPDGKIDPSFTLKDPSHPDFNGNTAERKALDTWLKTMAELRYRPLARSEEDFQNLVEQAKANGEYYQVPLTEASFGNQVRSLNIFKALKNKVDQYKELTEDVFAGQTEEKENWRKNNPWELYNKFNKDTNQRAKLIEEYGVGFFETNLEEVINQALVAYNKTRLSRKFIPIIDGMRVALRCNATYGGAKMKETLDGFDKLVKSKFYGESIIDPSLQPYARWVQALKSGFSKLALGFNFRSFFRELFQGTWMGLSRSGMKLLPGVDAKTFTEAAMHVVTNAHKNFSSISLLQQMNSQYGMANYSMAQIARQRRKNWYGIRNWRSDTLFLTSSAPDFQHRMSILVAKMMGDGCWEAHSLDKDGFLKYDFYKDKRFSVYLSGDTNNRAYIDQKANYLARIEELNKAGIKKEDGSDYKAGENGLPGDPLPMAYLPKEIQAIKNFADLLYGHYDDESKSLINDMFLGSMFLQYKTYVTSRVEQWTMTPGIYNTELLQHAVDPITGEKLYKVHTGNIDEEGLPIIEVKTEKNIENFDELVKEGKIEACMEWKGIPMEGMGRSYIKFAKDAFSWNWADFKEKWDDPIERDNILIGLHDCLLMSLAMMLVTAIFGLILKGEWTTDTQKVAKAARDAGWGSSLMYNIAYGSFQDFPFWQTLSTMFGDFNPSVVTSAKRIVENTGNVILGNKTIFQAVTNTVGAAGDLRGVANRLAEAAKEA